MKLDWMNGEKRIVFISKKHVNRNAIITALINIRAKIHDSSQVSLESPDEESTLEQLEKLDQM
jgi:hypothetical protein